MGDSFPKYPKIKRIGDDENAGILASGWIVVQEKMDGANFRFTREAHLDPEYHTEDRHLVFGSRNVAYKNEKDVDESFEHAIEFIRENIDIEALERLEEGWGQLVFYGEAMHPHTLDYKWDDVPSFLGFDVVRVMDGGKTAYLDWNKSKGIFDAVDLPTAPIRHYGDPNEYDPDPEDLEPSEYRNGMPEGVVIKNEETGQRAKVRTPKFKEKHGGQSPTNPDDYDPDDAEVLARTYTTEARVLKMIHKYEDRGRTIEMAVMEDLWEDVFDDIIEEEHDEIFLGNHVIDTKQFRSEVASITADVLDRYLSRPDESVLNEAAA